VTLATLQQLRSFNDGEHPLNLEPGQIAFNMSTSNFDEPTEDFNMFMYVGNATNNRLDEGGTVLVTGGDPLKGWVRYRMRNVSVQGGNVFGNLTIKGSKLKVESNGAALCELVVPKESSTPSNGTETGSIRWNTVTSTVQAWNGSKWDSTSKVSVGAAAPTNPSHGDLWFNSALTNPVLYVFVVPSSGPAGWVAATSAAGLTALQPGNGVTANSLNQIEIINTGSF
jgi:hypothetical protein